MSDAGRRGGIGGEQLRRWRIVRATSQAIPSSVRRFNQRRRERRMRSAKPWLIAAAVLVLVGTGVYVVYGTSAFGVARIRVVGSGFIGDRAVTEAAAVKIGTPLVRVHLDRVAAQVETLVGVESARVHRDWPTTLVIDVTPRTAIAAVPDGKAYDLVDVHGVPFRTSATPGDLPIVQVANPGPDDQSTIAALSVLRSLPTGIRDQLIRITASDPADVELILDGGRRVIWGDASDNAAKGRVAASLLTRPGTVIDVSAPSVVTVR